MVGVASAALETPAADEGRRVPAAVRGGRRGGRRSNRSARGDGHCRCERGLLLRRLLRGELLLELALELRLPRGLGRLQVRDLALDRAEQLLALAELLLDRGACGV